jgi:hypothetical protein
LRKGVCGRYSQDRPAASLTNPTIAASFSTVFQLRAVPTGAFLVFFQSRSSIDSPMPSMKST